MKQQPNYSPNSNILAKLAINDNTESLYLLQGTGGTSKYAHSSCVLEKR